MRNISPFLLSKINKQNQTKWENADPKLSIQVSRAKTTVMDSTYWTVETIRTKEGLGDLSTTARRYVPYGGPNKLFNIYVDNGVVKVATRDYPDYQKNKWVDQFSLGPGSAVAIALDGTWELYRKKWQMVTDELPFLFWVNNGTLYRQYWDDESTRRELATSVSKVKALRGWKNVNFPDRDHGIVCAYIKTNGKVYYRNYCLQLDGTIAWENEREIEEFTGTAININLFITNDYRTGFMIEDSQGKIHWVITERNWAGMAIIPDRIYATPHSIKLDLIEIEYPEAYQVVNLKAYTYKLDFRLGYAKTDNKFLDIFNVPVTLLDENNEEYDDWGKVLIFETKHEFYNLNNLDFIIEDSKNRTYTPDLVEEIGENKYKLTFTGIASFNNVGEIGTLKFRGLYTQNAVGEVYDPFEKVFHPLNLEPDEVGPPEVEAIWNE